MAAAKERFRAARRIHRIVQKDFEATGVKQRVQSAYRILHLPALQEQLAEFVRDEGILDLDAISKEAERLLVRRGLDMTGVSVVVICDEIRKVLTFRADASRTAQDEALRRAHTDAHAMRH